MDSREPSSQDAFRTWFRVYRFRVLRLGGLGFRVLGLSLGFRVLGLRGLGFRVWRLGCANLGIGSGGWA